MSPDPFNKEAPLSPAGLVPFPAQALPATISNAPHVTRCSSVPDAGRAEAPRARGQPRVTGKYLWTSPSQIPACTQPVCTTARVPMRSGPLGLATSWQRVGLQWHLVVFPGVGPTRLLPGLCPVNGLQCTEHQVLQLQGLHQVSVPDHPWGHTRLP